MKQNNSNISNNDKEEKGKDVQLDPALRRAAATRYERTSCTSFVRCNDMWLAKDNFKTLLLLVIQDGRAVLISTEEKTESLSWNR